MLAGCLLFVGLLMAYAIAHEPNAVPVAVVFMIAWAFMSLLFASAGGRKDEHTF